jgi:hypothetical protein
MRLFTDQLNAHIDKLAKKQNIPIHWCLPALLAALQALQAGLWLEITSRTCFKNPIISKKFKLEAVQLAEQPSKIEESYSLIDQGLSQITQELAVIQ